MSKITMSDVRAIIEEQSLTEEILKKLSRLRWESDNPDDVRLGMLADKLNDRRNQLLESTRWIARKMDEIAKRLSHKQLGYPGINSMGELQSSGPQHDVHCALYCEAYEELNRELARRSNDEMNNQYNDRVSSLPPGHRAILQVLSTSDRTARQLAGATDSTLEDTVAAIVDLTVQHLVETIGTKHYRCLPVHRWRAECERDEQRLGEMEAARKENEGLRSNSDADFRDRD